MQRLHGLNRTLRKAIALLLVIAIVLSTNSSFVQVTSVMADESNIVVYSGTDSSGNEPVSYTLTFDKSTGVITEYTGTAAVIQVPEEIEGVKVTGIGEFAFGNYPEQAEAIEKVILPEGLTSIQAYAFSLCSNMTDITIPSTVTELGKAVFSGCMALETIKLSDKITKIPEGAFNGSGLKTIELSENITEIGPAAFAYSSLESISIPDSVKTIGEQAFLYCSYLREITLPENLTEISKQLFESSGIKSITLPKSLVSIGDFAFKNTKLESIMIPDSVTYLGEQAFSESELKSVTLSKNIKEISNNAFWSCNLEKLIIPEGVEVIGDYAFDRNEKLASIVFPTTLKSIGEYAFCQVRALTELELPESVTDILHGAFSECTGLTAIKIPSSVTNLDQGAFYGLLSLSKLTVPGNIETIKYEAFRSGGMKEVIIEDGVKTIEDYSFGNCGNLMYITIPASVTTIGQEAFSQVNEAFTIRCYSNTVAHDYAILNKYKYELIDAETGSAYTVVVKDRAGNKLTDGYTVNWYLKDGSEPVGTGLVLKGADETKEYEYEVVLNETLCSEYKQPERAAVNPDSAGNVICTLDNHAEIQLTGTLYDSDKKPVSGGVVSCKQFFDNDVKQVVSATSDVNGKFTVKLKAVPTDITVKCDGYYNIYITEIFDNEKDCNLGDIKLTKAAQGRVNLRLVLEGAAEEGSDKEKTNLSSAENLRINITDENGNAIEEIQIQGLNALLPLEKIAESETIKISVADPEGQWDAESVSLKLDENKNGSAEIVLKEKGSFILGTVSGVSEAYALLFGENGKYLKTYDAVNYLQGAPMEDGNYSLVLVKKHNALYSVPSMITLGQLGLEEGVHYICENVNVRNGILTNVGDLQVPNADLDAVRYTVDGNTYLNSSSSKAAAGTSFILRASYEIDEKYESKNQSVKLALPEGVKLYLDGVTVDGKASTYSEDETGITVPITSDGKTHVVRVFCIATKPGEQNISAYLSFNNGKGLLTQSIGSVKVNVSEASIELPVTTYKERVTVSGKAIPGSEVTVYDSDVEVGKTIANKVGSWSLEFELVKPYDFSYHFIQASIQSDEQEILTEEKCLIHDVEYKDVTVSTVTMYNWGDGDNITTFDFSGNDNQKQSIPFYGIHPDYPTFTFTVKFKGDNSGISEAYVVTTDSLGEETYISLSYDEIEKVWYGTYDYTSFDIAPVEVGVHYWLENADVGSYDPQKFADSVQQYEDIVDDLTNWIEFSEIGEEVDGDNAFYYEINKAECNENKVTFDLIDVSDESESKEIKVFGSYIVEIKEETRTEEELINQGYYILEDGVYAKGFMTSNSMVNEYVEINEQLCYTESVILNAESSPMKLQSRGYVDFVSNHQEVMDNILDVASLIPGYGQIVDLSKLAIDTAGNQFVWRKTLYGNVKSLNYELDTLEYLLALRCEDGTPRVRDHGYYTQQVAYLRSDVITYTVAGEALFASAMALEAINRSISDALGKGALKSLENLNLNNKQLSALKDWLVKVRNWSPSQSKKFEFTLAETGVNGLLYASGLGKDAIVKGITDKFGNEYLIDALGINGMEPHIENLLNIDYANLVKKIEELRKNILSHLGECKDEPSPSPSNSPKPSTTPTPSGSPQPSGSPKPSGSPTPSASPSPKPTPQPSPKPGGAGGLRTEDEPVNKGMDPSGFIYEAVESNRVEGAKVTVYEKNAETGAVNQWKAEEYDQINPQITKENGLYAWYVPEGKWKVEVEKDGYEKADSSTHEKSVDGWLPVPPPQLDINIGIVSKALPNVKQVTAYADGVEVIFSQYMDIDSVLSGLELQYKGKTLSSEVSPVNTEESPDGEQYATRFMITSSDKNYVEGINLQVSKTVKNYVGNEIKEAYVSEELEINRRLEAITAARNVDVKMHEAVEFDVTLMPVLSGQKLKVSNMTPGIISLETTGEIISDNEGKAKISVKGILPGTGIIQIEDVLTGIVRTVNVNVEDVNAALPEKIEKVVVSLPDGSVFQSEAVVEKGQELILTTETEGAVIRYTTDGTCPCKDTAYVYEAPIEINEDTYLRVAAVKDGVYSETGRYRVLVNQTYIKGDVNSDGLVNANDALLVLKHAAKISILTEQQEIIGDLNEDIKVDASDALIILKIAAKIPL